MSDEIVEIAPDEAPPGSEFCARSGGQNIAAGRATSSPGSLQSPQLAPTDDAGDASEGRPTASGRPPPDAADPGFFCAENRAPDAVRVPHQNGRKILSQGGPRQVRSQNFRQTWVQS